MISNHVLASVLLIANSPLLLSEEMSNREIAWWTFVHFPGGQCEAEVLKPILVPLSFPKKVIAIPAFWLATTEVTVGEFKLFCDTTSYVTEPESGKARGSGYVPKYPRPLRETLTWKAPGFDQTDDCPVTCVTHHDVEEYCKWLTKHHALTFRLPNTGEWQYAHRYGNNGENDFDGEPTDYVNLADRALGDYERIIDKESGRPEKKSYRETRWNDGFIFTVPVRAKKAWRNGLYFMHGNVGEICDLLPELFDDTFERLTGPKLYAMCGGGWLADFETMPVHISRVMVPGTASNSIGFRLVCDFKEE